MSRASRRRRRRRQRRRERRARQSADRALQTRDDQALDRTREAEGWPYPAYALALFGPMAVPVLPLESFRDGGPVAAVVLMAGLLLILFQLMVLAPHAPRGPGGQERTGVVGVLLLDAFQLHFGGSLLQSFGWHAYALGLASFVSLLCLPLALEHLPSGDPQGELPEESGEEAEDRQEDDGDAHPGVTFLPSRGARAGEAADAGPVEADAGAVRIVAASEGDEAEPECPYCGAGIAAGEARLACRTCGIPHHEDCWQDAGSCTTYGCEGNRARRVAG